MCTHAVRSRIPTRKRINKSIYTARCADATKSERMENKENKNVLNWISCDISATLYRIASNRICWMKFYRNAATTNDMRSYNEKHETHTKIEYMQIQWTDK